MTLETKLDIPKEFKAQDIEANCFFTPRTWRDFLCYASFVILTTSFFWLTGLYLWTNPKNKDEERVGEGIALTGIIISALAVAYVLIICLKNCGKPDPKEESVEMQAA
eukprot:gene4631-8590_t